MNYFTTFRINDHIYQIKDSMGVLTTLVIGDTKALLIDTGYGIKNIKEHISTLTNLPIVVASSHGHMDHTGGNYLFDEVYIDQKDVELCIKHNSEAWRKREIATATSLNLIDESFDKESFIAKREGNLKLFETNHTFNLGNITVKVIPMEGHTKGSVGFYLEEDNYLVVSDATCPFVWMFLEESTTVDIYIKMLERTLLIPFTHVLLGHGAGKLIPRSRVEEFLDVAKNIDLEKSVRVSFNNFDNSNSYCYTTGTMYNQDHAGIVFDPDKLK